MNNAVSQTPDALLSRGLEHHKAGRLDDAIAMYRAALDADPKSHSARYLIGVAHLDKSNFQEAVATLRAVVDERPNAEKAVYALSIVHARLGSVGLERALIDRHKEMTTQSDKDIVVFGDSHAEYCFLGIPRCAPHLIGFYTMHRIGRDGTGVLDVRKYGVRNTDTAVFIFGEIDVRLHIGRQRDERGRDVTEIIEDLAVRYFRTIAENAHLLPDLRVIVSSVVPPSERHPQEVQPKYGTLSDRVAFARMLNTRIEALCREHGFGHLDLFTPFAKEDGTMNPAFTRDTVHVEKEFHRIVELALRCTMLQMGW